MRTGRGKQALVLTNDEHERLLAFTRRGKTAQRLAMRARIVLRCAEGRDNQQVAGDLNVSRLTVGKWRRRFLEKRLNGLLDEARPGAPRKITDAKVEQIVVATLESTPQGATHWSTRQMARQMGVGRTRVSEIWQAFRLKPHRSESYKLSNDPLLVEKVRDIIGLYISPPDRALVLCVDEKSQIQALNRTQPVLPMRIGQVERRSHDYDRHGTTTLFAALDIQTGRLIAECHHRHRTIEFQKFLERIKTDVPDDLEVHLVLDNYGTHKSAAITRWLKRHPRFHMHFTPTYSSWINQVERVFAELTERQIKRGAHTSVAALKRAIHAFIDARNADPRPFAWTKSADVILAKIAAGANKTLQTHRHPISQRTSRTGH
jgi:transposase